MDNFMENITHKFSANDMILANAQAEAMDLDSKKEQIQRFEAQLTKVDNALSDMREVNLKNIEAAQDVQNMAQASSEKIDAAVERMETQTVTKIKETSDISIAGITKTVDESLAKIEKIKESSDMTETINDSIASVSQKLDTIKKELEEYAHADHVKIYRNVQAAVTEELGKQTEELQGSMKKKGAIFPLVIVTLVVSILNLATMVCLILGLF